MPVTESIPVWTVRQYLPGDEEGLVALFARVFGRPRTLEHWRWKLAGKGAPGENVWVAVTPDGEIVGHYGGLPLKLKLAGRIYPAIHSVEAMTDPQFRRQGMLTQLGSAAHEAWAESGYVAVIGLPNDQWGTRNSALGYRGLFPLAWLRFPLDAGQVLARPGVLPGMIRSPLASLGTAGSHVWNALAARARQLRMSGGDMEVTETGDPRMFDEVYSKLERQYANMVVRDRSWVEWRFIHAPQPGYKILVASRKRVPSGYIAYKHLGRRGRSNGYIADIFAGRNDAAVIAALVDAALRDLRARGAAMVMATAIPGSALYRHLLWNGFLPTPRRTRFTFEVVPLDPVVDLARLASPMAWHLTAGDFDVV